MLRVFESHYTAHFDQTIIDYGKDCCLGFTHGIYGPRIHEDRQGIKSCLSPYGKVDWHSENASQYPLPNLIGQLNFVGQGFEEKVAPGMNSPLHQ